MVIASRRPPSGLAERLLSIQVSCIRRCHHVHRAVYQPWPEDKSGIPQSGTEKVGGSQSKLSTQSYNEKDEIPLSALHKNSGSEVISKRYVRKSSPVPKSRASRLWHIGNLAANIGLNVLLDSLKKNVKSNGKGAEKEGSGIIQDNLELIVQKFAKLRGAALKVAQLLCMHGTMGYKGDEILQHLLVAQNNAHSMSEQQLKDVLLSSLGPDWCKKFKSFEITPFAAASIGQVHAGETLSGEKVAIKVQYPGVDESIDSDIRNILGIFSMVKVLPKGLFLENILQTIRAEYINECDYRMEAKNLQIFSEKVAPYGEFYTPRVHSELSSKKVITTDHIQGLSFSKCFDLPQEDRDFISYSLFKLCLLELFEFNIMQTDPNWSNFIYDQDNKKIALIDFGACSSFSKDFLRSYARLLIAASKRNVEDCILYSKDLGYLTGNESKTMLNAHIKSLFNIARPFWHDGPEIFDFSSQRIVQEVQKNISIIFEERLVPPPPDTYSLHRKLTGIFLLCSKLRSRVACKELIKKYALPAAELPEDGK